MTLEDFYFISQIIAATLLFASLLFVGIQIRQNTKAVRASSAFEVNRMWGERNLTTSQDPEAAAFLTKMFDPSNTPDDFTEAELNRAGLMYIAYWQLWLAQFRLYQEGSLLKEDWELHGRQAARFRQYPLMQYLIEASFVPIGSATEFTAEIARLSAVNKAELNVDRPHATPRANAPAAEGETI
ncbi:MAG: hypothetical protein ABJP48_04175 [Erythrobacter sp.]